MHSYARHVIRYCLFAFALAAATIVPVTGTAQAAPAPVPTVIRDCTGKPLIKPRTIDSIFCADLGIIVTNISWSRWTPRLAEGSGVEHRKTCIPNCAEGPVQVQPISLRLFDVKRGDFRRITLIDEYGKTETHQLTGLHR